MSSALLTGGLGFIGSYMAQRLKNCVIIDNLSTCGKESKAMAEEAIKQNGHELIYGDICSKKLLDITLDSVDKVYHLAAVPRVVRSIKDPLLANKNIDGTITLFKACSDKGIKKIVYASSSSVYGDYPGLRDERVKPNPLNPYAVSKLAGELYATVFNQLYGTKIASMRYFNVYGYGQETKSEYACVVPKFFACARLGRPLPIYGDGTATRYFTYVKDIVDANIKAMGKTGIYNICANDSVSVNELAKLIIDQSRSISHIEYLPNRKGDMGEVIATNKLAKKELGWSPKYTIRKGLGEQWLTLQKY